MVTCSSDRTWKLIESGGSEIFSINLGDNLRCLTCDGHTLLLGGDSGVLRVWNMQSGEEEKQIKTGSSNLSGSSGSNTNFGNNNSSSNSSGNASSTSSSSSIINRVICSRDGRMIVVGGAGGVVKFYRVIKQDHNNNNREEEERDEY